jgi:thymidylate kinase
MLVVIDGLDASGKSTQAEMLAKHLKEDGEDVRPQDHRARTTFSVQREITCSSRGRRFLL